ncbi:MAG: acyl-CoA dehydrogenase family protein [Gemmatales bacterium]|nr:acyl-CoA/acyl-ACP dehydrogenase [Gemmatales bacterium]MDW7993107.1 acyl-CoA dehydrogenase family protein [Gemmatales bacterium]
MSEANRPSFAETALAQAGKSAEEVRRLGAVDRADEQVEALFQPQYQTVNSPVHRAVWEGQVPMALFDPPPLEPAPCDAVLERCYEVLQRARAAQRLWNEQGKVSQRLLDELAEAGYWGLLISPDYGGSGVPFAKFTRFLTRMATLDATVAGLASVHGCIGAVDPLMTFGTVEQKQRFLPRLARGEVLSGFALTEPNAGSDLTALRTVARPVPGGFEITGEKLFITNAIPGRLVALVALLEGRPAVFVVELPSQEDEHFRMVRYGLYALAHNYNNGLRFERFFVPQENLLQPPGGDGLMVAYHGLNRGRLALCALAAGSMRVMLASLIPWVHFRRTYGKPIGARELVRFRLAKLAGYVAAADALTAWGSWLLDLGYRGELEGIVAKIFGSEAMKESAIEILMKTHGGRAFLHGHLFGDNVHDFLAPCIYEGEGQMLALAFFKSLAKEHGRRYFEPIGRRLNETGMTTFRLWNPLHVWRLRRELWAYGRWWLAHRLRPHVVSYVPRLHPRLRPHAQWAEAMFPRYAEEISAMLRKYQLRLADRQVKMMELSLRIQDTVTVLVTALWADRQNDEAWILAADVLCRELRRRWSGRRISDDDVRTARQLAELILDRRFPALAGVEEAPILMPYPEPAEVS